MVDVNETKPHRGADPSLIQAFGIRGLYGYKSVSLATEYAAAILIAKNGSGKTTLLGAMDAFLKCQFTRLRGLTFSEIFCKLRGLDEPLTLSHADLIQFLEIPSEGEFAKLARQTEIDLATLFNFLLDEWSTLRNDQRSWHDNATMSAIFRASDWNHLEVVSLCDRIREGLFGRTEKIARIYDALKEALKSVEIVYLPTYRRIELALPEDKERRVRRGRSPRFFKAAPGSLHTADIQFGLSDISDRLSEMNQRILLQSNTGYRNISANIINELIDGSYQEDAKRTIPSRDELTLFFSRLQASERMAGPFYPVAPPNLDRLYSDEVNKSASGGFLNYFLNKLGTVINATHDVELQVEDFINRCNRYLSQFDTSTSLQGEADKKPIDVDAKELRLNRQDLRVHVESLSTGRKISLDSLSSGEKQMVSLFGKLFLYAGEKIVLIDEPELSLSIEWQRQILADVMDAPMCRQLVAITHSPFVFDNALDPFARSLRVELDSSALSHSDEFEVDLE